MNALHGISFKYIILILVGLWITCQSWAIIYSINIFKSSGNDKWLIQIATSSLGQHVENHYQMLHLKAIQRGISEETEWSMLTKKMRSMITDQLVLTRKQQRCHWFKLSDICLKPSSTSALRGHAGCPLLMTSIKNVIRSPFTPLSSISLNVIILCTCTS